jgi:UDP-N-acetylglucosamine--N-acetylmuramyl-(pentapeptide) pyrophosphoryl-undecaprenol N-acetylglucosamine transferase
VSSGTIRILVTGGGTGGHVGPALAVIQTLQERAASDPKMPPPVFRYVGSVNGIEAKLAREAGIEFVGVASGKLRRSSRGPLGLLSGANLRDAFQIPVGIGQAMRAVRAFRPDVVLATGGYVSVPPVIAAGLNGVPILTHEQTVTVGLANKITGRFARRIALTFEGAMRDLPPALRAKAVRNRQPVRAAIFSGNKTQAVSRFFPNALPDRRCTAQSVCNRAARRGHVSSIVPYSPPSPTCCPCAGSSPVRPAAGRNGAGFRRAHGRRQDASGRAAAPVLPHALCGYDEIGDVYALSDLLVARSGAGTVTEACALGKPALFIPLVPTGGDEQTRNAQRSVDAGGAVILPQARCDAPHLLECLRPLLADPARRRAMGAAAHTLARPNAASDLADALLELAPKR